MKETKTKACVHDVRIRGIERVCATCKTSLGPAYTLSRMNDDIQFLLRRVAEGYADQKMKFMAEAQKDASNAIRWYAYDLLVSQHRAEYVRELQAALKDAPTTRDKRDIVRDEKSRLTRHLTRGSAAEWDTSTSPFSNQDMKARTVADAKSLHLLDEIMDRFDKADEEAELPRME